MPCQVLLLPPGTPALGQDGLQAALTRRLAAWGIDTNAALSLIQEPDALDPKHPVAIVFFGYAGIAAADDEGLKRLLREGHLVIPTVAPDIEPRAQLPTPLHEILAEPRSEGWTTRVADRLLEEFELGPGRARVFISYARRGGTMVARQLERALQQRSWSVFFDAHALRSGDKLEPELHRAISRSQVVIQLATPGAVQRPWVRREALMAWFMGVGLLVVRWPNASNATDGPQSLALHKDEFSGGVLTQGGLCRVLDEFEEMRVRAVALRRDRLERAIVRYAHQDGLTAIRDSLRRWIDVGAPNGGRVDRFCPLVGWPSSHELQAVASRGHELADPLALIDAWSQPHDHLGHLAWLVSHLPIGLALHAGRPSWQKY